MNTRTFFHKVGFIFLGILVGIIVYALIYEIFCHQVGGYDSEGYHKILSTYPYIKPFLWILGFFVGSIFAGYIGKKNGVMLGFFIAFPLAIFTFLAFLDSISKNSIASIAGGYSTIIFLFIGVFVFCSIGGKLGEIASHNLIFKGTIGGLFSYLAIVIISSIVFLLINMINSSLSSAYLTTTGIILLIGYSGFLGAVIAVITNKPTVNWVIFYMILIIIPISFITIATNETISVMFLITFIGGYLGYLKNKSKRIRFFLLFALPSFGRVPKFNKGIYLDEEAAKANEMAVLPLFSITSSFIIGVAYGIIDNFRNSLWGAITGSIFGLFFGFIYLMIIGNIVRKFIGLSVKIDDLETYINKSG
jgi:hypothetical protein